MRNSVKGFDLVNPGGGRCEQSHIIGKNGSTLLRNIEEALYFTGGNRAFVGNYFQRRINRVHGDEGACVRLPDVF